ncbi:hypothetical protein ABPG73_019983 [Tetrahymena malaccensis]
MKMSQIFNKKAVDSIVKICVAYNFCFVTYCFYLYSQSGLLQKVSQSHPILTTILIFYASILLNYATLKKKHIGLVILAIAINAFCIFIIGKTRKFVIHYFDLSKGCGKLANANPIFQLLIDQNYDKYFNETSKVLCSQKCPCKWNNNTEVYYDFKHKYKINKYDGAKSVQECPEYLAEAYIDQQKISYLYEMIDLELYGCSGYCEKQDIYSVTDINYGKPSKKCFDIHRQLQKETYKLLIIGIDSLPIIFIMLIPSICYIFYDQKRQRIQNQQEEQDIKTDIKVNNSMVSS